MSEKGHSRPMHSASSSDHVRYASIATEMLQCGECGDVPEVNVHVLVLLRSESWQREYWALWLL
jgi:hypothetical protein